jgi:hypothetical protein
MIIARLVSDGHASGSEADYELLRFQPPRSFVPKGSTRKAYNMTGVDFARGVIVELKRAGRHYLAAPACLEPVEE